MHAILLCVCVCVCVCRGGTGRGKVRFGRRPQNSAPWSPTQVGLLQPQTPKPPHPGRPPPPATPHAPPGGWDWALFWAGSAHSGSQLNLRPPTSLGRAQPEQTMAGDPWCLFLWSALVKGRSDRASGRRGVRPALGKQAPLGARQGPPVTGQRWRGWETGGAWLHPLLSQSRREKPAGRCGPLWVRGRPEERVSGVAQTSLPLWVSPLTAPKPGHCDPLSPQPRCFSSLARSLASHHTKPSVN